MTSVGLVVGGGREVVIGCDLSSIVQFPAGTVRSRIVWDLWCARASPCCYAVNDLRARGFVAVLMTGPRTVTRRVYVVCLRFVLFSF